VGQKKKKKKKKKPKKQKNKKKKKKKKKLTLVRAGLKLVQVELFHPILVPTQWKGLAQMSSLLGSKV
jgi:hypothetical protein